MLQKISSWSWSIEGSGDNVWRVGERWDTFCFFWMFKKVKLRIFFATNMRDN